MNIDSLAQNAIAYYNSLNDQEKRDFLRKSGININSCIKEIPKIKPVLTRQHNHVYTGRINRNVAFKVSNVSNKDTSLGPEKIIIRTVCNGSVQQRIVGHRHTARYEQMLKKPDKSQWMPLAHKKSSDIK